MPFGAKTNERPGTRAQARYIRMSPSKARAVLDLIRGRTVAEAHEVLALVERDAADVIAKVLDSAVANAVANDDQDPDRLFVSACYADEGPTLKRFRPRARGRATTIRKRSCHITVIVTRMSDEQVARAEAAEAASGAGGRKSRVSASRAARVAKSRKQDVDEAGLDTDVDDETDAAESTDTAAQTDTSDAVGDAADDGDVEEVADGAETPADEAEADQDETVAAGDTDESSEAKETD